MACYFSSNAKEFHLMQISSVLIFKDVLHLIFTTLFNKSLHVKLSHFALTCLLVISCKSCKITQWFN